MRNRTILAAAAIASATPAMAEPAAELSTGIEYQEGDYGTGERVETLSVRNAVRIEAGRTFFTASLPYHRLEAPGNVVGGGGGLLGLPIIIDPTEPPTRQVREGLGDLRLGVGHTLPRLGGVDLTLSGQVKLPTASARRGLGTGEIDFSIGAEAARTVGRVTPFAAISYTMPGNPDDFELRNSFAARGGVVAQLSSNLRGTLAYGYAQSLSPLVPDEQQLSTGLNVGLSRQLSLGLYGSAGLSEGAPDIGAGLQLGW